MLYENSKLFVRIQIFWVALLQKSFGAAQRISNDGRYHSFVWLFDSPITPNIPYTLHKTLKSSCFERIKILYDVRLNQHYVVDKCEKLLIRV